MKFLELNKKRHAVKHFNDKLVDYKDLRTAIEIATLSPSANNLQPWKFVVVKDKKAELAQSMSGHAWTKPKTSGRSTICGCLVYGY